MDISYKALVLKSVDYKENDKLITAYAFDKGIITITARGCKKAKSKLNFATFPMTLGNFQLVERNGIYILAGCDLIEKFYDIHSELDRYYGAYIVLEFLSKFTPENETNDELAIFCLKALSKLCYTKHETTYIIIKFFYKSLKLIGYGFNIEKCLKCKLNAKQICEYCKAGFDKLKIDAIETLCTIIYSEFELLDTLNFNEKTLIEILNLFYQYSEYNGLKNLTTFKQYLSLIGKIS